MGQSVHIDDNANTSDVRYHVVIFGVTQARPEVHASGIQEKLTSRCDALVIVEDLRNKEYVYHIDLGTFRGPVVLFTGTCE